MPFKCYARLVLFFLFLDISAPSKVGNEFKRGLNSSQIKMDETSCVSRNLLESKKKKEEEEEEDLLIEAKMIAFHLRKVANEELLVAKIQSIIDSSPMISVPIDYEEEVDALAERMRRKLRTYKDILNRNGAQIKASYKRAGGDGKEFKSCCGSSLPPLSFDKHFGTKISGSSSCSILSSLLSETAFVPGQNLSSTFKENLVRCPSIKWQYFMSPWGVYLEHPAYHHDAYCRRRRRRRRSDSFFYPDEGIIPPNMISRHRETYLSTVLPDGKSVILLLDFGSALSDHQLKLGKAVAKHILNSLSHRDRVGLIAISSDVTYPQTGSCLSNKMAYANHETKFHFHHFIDTLKGSREQTNHIQGFMNAFGMINRTLMEEEEALIVYISRGLLGSLADARIIMESISRQLDRCHHKVVINSYGLIDESKPVMYEMTFLRDLAEGNFPKYNVDPVLPAAKRRKGIMVPINSTHHLGFTISAIYSSLYTARDPRTSTHFSLSYWDPLSKDLQISMSQSVVIKGTLIGVVGVDVSLSDVGEDAIHYPSSPASYTFIIEKGSGTVLSHPSLGRPSVAHQQPMDTDISHLEQWTHFPRVRGLMMTEPRGHESIDVNSELGTVTFYWRHIPDSPYILSLVLLGSQGQRRYINNYRRSGREWRDPSFIYHRLDLITSLSGGQHHLPPPPRLCRHFKELATIDTVTLFLSASSFKSPYRSLLQSDSILVIQKYLAYLNDPTELISNPGLKENVREDILTMGKISKDWKRQWEEGDLSKYIVHRYLGTQSGAFLLFPGALMDDTFEPNRRDWYRGAILYPGRIVFTAPYLDGGGSGYVVTMSQTITSTSGSNKKDTMGVLGLDFTLGYFHKLFMDAIPICSDKRITCFIMDDRGYLIAHPRLVEPAGPGPIEYTHITHVMPLIANDINMNHKGFVRKHVCNRYGDRTIQRFYRFNTSLDGRILRNVALGEHCTRYQITSLPGTNVFIGIVNQTCDVITAFCPCSMTDRLCLNCHRMEQIDCECPCECPLEMNLCSGKLFDIEDRNPSCEPHSEKDGDFMAGTSYGLHRNFPDCFPIDCFSHKTQSQCLGVMGCEWCQISYDGKTPLQKKYCSQQNKCFGGVLGAITPYEKKRRRVGMQSDHDKVPPSPVGAVAGAISACFLVIALSVYCYRYHVQRVINGQYRMSGIRETNVRMSQLDEVEESQEPHLESSRPIAQNVLVGPFDDGIVVVSPYRLNPGYRRPPGGDSDHGYSTMTPHEESEQVGPTANAEPLVILKEAQHKTWPNSIPSAGSATSSILGSSSHSPLQDLCPSVTKMPKSSSFLAQVQVHEVDTH